MIHTLEDSQSFLECVVGGLSALDLPRLDIQSLEEAHRFIKSYGYDPQSPVDLEQIWIIHRQSVSFLRDHLLEAGEMIPHEISDPLKLQDPGFLLLYASSREQGQEERGRWSCAVLRVMHVISHINNDLFMFYSNEIQDQILRPYREHIVQDPILGVALGRASTTDQIHLHQFDTKPFKTSESAVVKLLSKPQSTAMTLLDRMGIRFVTKGVFDAFRVLRYLVDEHLVSFPNVMPDQARNTLYPLNLLIELLGELPKTATPDQVEAAMSQKLEQAGDRAKYFQRENQFSGAQYRSIKFIVRHLVQLKLPERTVRFFFPYEVQIVDYEAFLSSLSGPTAHQEYKKRQKMAARQRVLPPT